MPGRPGVGRLRQLFGHGFVVLLTDPRRVVEVTDVSAQATAGVLERVESGALALALRRAGGESSITAHDTAPRRAHE